MVRYLLHIGYIGTKYRGTQIMKEFPNKTIQGVIEKGLLTLKPRNIPRAHFASRTDKGVHALMNTFHVDLEHPVVGEVYQPHKMKVKLNSYLTTNEHDIVVKHAYLVPDNFHARFHAKWRSYCYRVAILKNGITMPPKSDCHQGYLPPTELNRCHLVSSHLNTSIVKRVADLYCGEHDFSSFTKYLIRDPWRNPRRIIDECQFYETSYEGCISDPLYSNISMWEFYIQSKGFLYHQIRKLVSTALSAGFGITPLVDVKSLLDNPDPQSWTKFKLAPPGGLYLKYIHYDPEDFNARSIENKVIEERTDNEEEKCDLL